MQIYKDGVLYASGWPSEEDNYGFVRKTYPAGSYSVFVKVTWHADDVKDYTLRTYLPTQVAITAKKFANDSEATDAFAALNFVSAKISLTSFGSSSNANYKWTRGWWGASGYFLQHSSTTNTLNCEYNITLIANAKSAKIITDANSVCTSTFVTGKTTFACKCS